MDEIVERPDGTTRLQRRDFMRMAGLGSAAIALAACGMDPTKVTQTASPSALAANATAGGVTLDFSSDVGVLNYAYALEQLEAAFYTQVVSNPQFTTAFSASEQRLLSDVHTHEVIHREFLKAALATAAIPGLTPNFSAIDFTSRTSVLTAAQGFEDLGVSAYNGAGKYIASAAYLTIAGKIVSVEARHASAIRDLLVPHSANFAPNPFDAPNTPQYVIGMAQAFVVEKITVINA